MIALAGELLSTVIEVAVGGVALAQFGNLVRRLASGRPPEVPRPDHPAATRTENVTIGMPHLSSGFVLSATQMPGEPGPVTLHIDPEILNRTR